MKRLLLMVVVLLSAALLAPAAAAAAAETETTHFSGTVSRAELNLCSGAPGTLTIVSSGVVHTTDLGDDRHGYVRPGRPEPAELHRPLDRAVRRGREYLHHR